MRMDSSKRPEKKGVSKYSRVTRTVSATSSSSETVNVVAPMGVRFLT